MTEKEKISSSQQVLTEFIHPELQTEKEENNNIFPVTENMVLEILNIDIIEREGF